MPHFSDKSKERLGPINKSLVGKTFGSFVANELTFVDKGKGRGMIPHYKCSCTECGEEYLLRWDLLIRKERNKRTGCGACNIRSKIVRCEVCGKAVKRFYAQLHNNDHVTCSYECKNALFKEWFNSENSPIKNKQIIRTCEWCDNEFKTLDKGNKTQRFCDYKCSSKYISHLWEERALGKKEWYYSSGARMRLTQEYQRWRSKVFENDDYICQVCEERGGKLNAHHIKNFHKIKYAPSYMLYDADIGITLCERCHREFHKRYGIKNNTEEQIMDFIANHKMDEHVLF